MTKPEIFFGAICRPCHFCLPTTEFIFGHITDCTGLSLGIDEDSPWAMLRTPDELEAFAEWLDGLWLRAVQARRQPYDSLAYSLTLFVPNISPQYECEEWDGATDLHVEACVSPPDQPLRIYFGTSACPAADPVMGDDFEECLDHELDVTTLASLIRDLATAERQRQLYLGRGEPLKKYFKAKPTPAPLMLTERRAA